MKKNIVVMAGCCLLLAVTGCEQKIDTWSGENVVYMDMDADSTVVSFAYIDTNVDTVKLRVAVMGEVAEGTARYVKVKVKEKNAVAGQDYEALQDEYEMKDGETYCTIPVVVNRPADQLEKEVEVELQENADFRLHYPEDVLTSGSAIVFTKTKHRVLFHRLMKEAPATWKEYFLGKFSAKKYETICEVMGIARTQFLSFSYMSYGRLRFIATYMKEWLEENPIKEEDGSVMRMGDYLYV